MYCYKCGEKIPKNSNYNRFCGHQLVGITDSKSGEERTQLSRKTIAAGIGAVIIFLSLAFPWYAARFSEASFKSDFFSTNINFMDIITGAGNGGPPWIGSLLPVIVLIIFASFTLLTVIYNIVEDVEDAKF